MMWASRPLCPPVSHSQHSRVSPCCVCVLLLLLLLRQAIRVSPPPCGGEGAAGAGGSKTSPPAFIMAHAPTCFTSQATASLEELIKMLGGRW